MSLSGYGCCAFGGAMYQHSLPIGLNGGRIIPEVLVRVEKEQSIPGWLEIGGIQVQLDVQIPVGRDAARRNAPGDWQVLRVRRTVVDRGMQRDDIAQVGIGLQFGRFDTDQVSLLGQCDRALRQCLGQMGSTSYCLMNEHATQPTHSISRRPPAPRTARNQSRAVFLCRRRSKWSGILNSRIEMQRHNGMLIHLIP